MTSYLKSLHRKQPAAQQYSNNPAEERSYGMDSDINYEFSYLICSWLLTTGEIVKSSTLSHKFASENEAKTAAENELKESWLLPESPGNDLMIFELNLFSRSDLHCENWKLTDRIVGQKSYFAPCFEWNGPAPASLWQSTKPCANYIPRCGIVYRQSGICYHCQMFAYYKENQVEPIEEICTDYDNCEKSGKCQTWSIPGYNKNDVMHFLYVYKLYFDNCFYKLRKNFHPAV